MRIMTILVIRGFEQLVNWIKGRMVGHLFIGGCTEPEAIGSDVRGGKVAFVGTITAKTATAHGGRG